MKPVDVELLHLPVLITTKEHSPSHWSVMTVICCRIFFILVLSEPPRELVQVKPAQIFYSPKIHCLVQALIPIANRYRLKSYHLYHCEGFNCQDSHTNRQSRARSLACDYNLLSGIGHGADNTTAPVMSPKR